MPTLTGPAVEPTCAGPGRVYVGAHELIAPLRPPRPTGGDPDTPWLPYEPPYHDPGDPWSPVRATPAPVVALIVGEAITRRPIGELTTAVIDDWCEDVEMLAGAPATATISAHDPMLAELAFAATLTADGTVAYEWNPKSYCWWIECDGETVWTGLLRQPVDMGDGTITLPLEDPSAVFDERILGRAEQFDHLGGKSNFESYPSIAWAVADGWRVPAGVTAQIVSGGVSGGRTLRVMGTGWVGSPRVTLMGGDGIGVGVIGSGFAKFHESVPEGSAVMLTWCQRTDSLAPSNPTVTAESCGQREGDSTAWTETPIVSGGRTSKNVVPHRCWVEMRSFPDVWTYYDLVTIRQDVQTGFPPGYETDLAYYVERIHRDLVSRLAPQTREFIEPGAAGGAWEQIILVYDEDFHRGVPRSDGATTGDGFPSRKVFAQASSMVAFQTTSNQAGRFG